MFPVLEPDKGQEKELLRPEELNQQNIEALVAESNLVTEAKSNSYKCFNQLG